MVTQFDEVIGRPDLIEKADVVVIGTGAGGGAIAAELAEGGRSVILLEEGGHYQARDFELDAPTMIKKLYRHAGASMIRGKPNIIFTEGRCVGGSTVINGGICWRTPEKVLARWRDEFGLTEMTDDQFDPIFTKVEQRINVAPQDEGSVGEDAELMKRGAEKLGWRVVPVRRNQKHCAGTNNCAFGCPTGAKQSTAVSYVPRVLSNGGRLFTGCRVEKILTDGHRATGVVGQFRHPLSQTLGPKITVLAKVVVLACGAIQTPALLLRNRMANSSGQVGRNFLCHPNAKAVAIYDHDVEAWKGTIQGYQVHEFFDEGLMMATTMIPPGLVAMSLPYIGDRSMTVMEKYNRMVMCGVLVEDTGAGRISLDLFGEAKMRYDLNDRDAENMIRGVALLAELYFASGAKEVLLPFVGLPSISSPDEIKKIFRTPIPKSEIECLTVHAMGTCRMGRDRNRSVVDEHGESHDVPSLFVADASVFPSPIGVNPQVSIMALATRTGQHILKREARYFTAA